MTDIIFSFDTENYVCPAGADGILRLAQILREENVRGCFLMVGTLVETLKEWGRRDVIEALKWHEVGTHTWAHTRWPMINEYTDKEDYEEALEEYLREEGRTNQVVKETFGVSALPASCSTSTAQYVARYGNALLGQPICAGDLAVYDPVRGRTINFCNNHCVRYYHDLGFFLLKRKRKHFAHGASYEITPMTEAEIRAHLDQIAEKDDTVVYAHHPCMGIYDEWWDCLNFWGGRVPAPEDWKEPIRLPQEMSERFFENFRTLVRLIKADPRFRIINYETLNRQLSYPRKITRKWIPALRDQLKKEFFPVTYPDSYCLSDLFHSCRAMLLGNETHECGFVYGFLEEPFAITSSVTVTKAQMEESAKRIPAEGWLPRSVVVGDTILGTADWLRAALEVLCGEETVTLSPDAWQIDLDQLPYLRDKSTANDYGSPTNLDRHLSRRDRLQTWTLRLPAGTCRKIF